MFYQLSFLMYCVFSDVLCVFSDVLCIAISIFQEDSSKLKLLVANVALKFDIYVEAMSVFVHSCHGLFIL